jgi:glycosyltransferase involved in cell wall biosynthesis
MGVDGSGMKIAILATDYREFAKDYDGPKPYFGMAVQALMQGLPAVPEVEFHVVSCLKQPVANTPKLAPNVYYHPVIVPRVGWTKTLYLGCSRATRRKLLEIKPDVVHGQGTERDCAISAVRSGFPSLITIHGYMQATAKALNAPLFSFHTLQARLEAWTIPRAGGIICLTNYARNRVQGRTPRTWILPNAVNESFFAVQRASEITHDILCVATISRLKNQNFLIRALEPLAAKHKYRLVFLGEGIPGDSYFDEFKTLVKERPWCSFEGHKKPDEVRNYLRSARFLITASREENCPMVILEAMAVGLAVAASKVGGIPDLVEDNVNGVMFDPENADSIREAVSKLLTDAAFAQHLAAQGHKRARERHHPAAIARKHLDIYREFLTKSPAKTP